MSEAVQTPDAPAEEVQTPEQPVEKKSYLNEDGSFIREAFGELGSHSIFDKYKNVEDLAKATINKDHVIGKKAEEWWASEDSDIVAKRRELMGIPSDASGYELPSIPDGILLAPERLDAFKSFAHELGIPKETAKKLVEWDFRNAQQSLEQRQTAELEAKTTAENELKGKWKNDYGDNVEKVGNLLDFLGLGELKDDPAYGNNPRFIEAAYEKLVPLVENDAIIEGSQRQTLETAKDRLDQLEEKIFTFPSDKLQSPEYKALCKERADLLNKIK